MRKPQRPPPPRWRKGSQDVDTFLIVRKSSRYRFYIPGNALVAQQAWGDFRDCPTFGGTFTKEQCKEFYSAMNGWSAVCEAVAQQAKLDCLQRSGWASDVICTVVCVPAGMPNPVGGIVCSLACLIVTNLGTGNPCDSDYSARLSGCLSCLAQCLQSSRYPQ